MLASVFPFNEFGGFAVFPLKVFPGSGFGFAMFPPKLPSYDTADIVGGSGVVGALWNPGYVVGSFGS